MTSTQHDTRALSAQTHNNKPHWNFIHMLLLKHTTHWNFIDMLLLEDKHKHKFRNWALRILISTSICIQILMDEMYQAAGGE
jgi:hypothetical protein